MKRSRSKGNDMRKQRLLTGIAGILMAFLFTGCNTSSVEEWVDEVVEDINGQIPDNTLLPVESVSEEKYVYGQLTEEEQLVYDEMLDAILNHREEVTVATLDKDVLAKMYEAIMADYGGLFWVDGYSYTEYSRAGVLTGLKFAPKYTMDEAARQETQAAIDEKVDVLLGGISSEDSDYQKARFIFDTLVRTVNYDLNAENNQNIISVFLEGRTVCQGYACATKYLMDLLDIPCTIVTGTANGEPHAWNLIELDGAYYYMDTTWGNPTSNSPDDFGDVAEVVDYCFFTATTEASVYKGYKRDKIEMRGDRAEMSDFPLYLNTVAGGLDRRDQTIGGFSFVVKIYALPVVEIIG